MITKEDFNRVLEALGEQGGEDVRWSEGLAFPANSRDFAIEAIWVICNSGMRYTVARLVMDRVLGAIRDGRPVKDAFGHLGKAAAMQEIWDRREEFYSGLQKAFGRYCVTERPEEVLDYLETLPWIGKITKYHLAKDCGLDCAKPDVHLERLARMEGVDVQSMCARLARETGYRIPTVDVVLWRACALGVVDSRTGRINLPDPSPQAT